jgi:hypothetical protein
MRWGHNRFLLGQKGKLLCDDGSIVPRAVAAGQVAGDFSGYNGFCGSCSTPFIEPQTSKFSSQLLA